MRSKVLALCATTALVVAACGGGSGGSAGSTSGTSGGASGGTAGGASAGAVSSGAITAFGSVFVDGYEFATGNAQVVDDDTGATSTGVAALEVGQVVDVEAASTSTSAAPVAQRLHIHPLVRGDVDAYDSTAGTLTVMGQTVALSSATLFSDHRACVTATTGACTPVSDATGLAVTTGSGTAATPGSYVSVDGYLFDAGSGVDNLVATLVSVHDVPTTSAVAAYKAEGVVSAVGAGTLTIGGLSVNLAGATCRSLTASATCASAFAVGDVVSAFASTSPSLPAATLNASVVLLRTHLPVQTAGATVEFDGSVSSFTAASGSTAATFTVRGVSVDTSALAAGTSLPAVGDIVQVVGTLSSDGTSVAASSIRIVRAARSASYAFEGDAGGVVAGSSSGSWTLTLLGESIVVSGQTRLADRSARGWFNHDPQSSPFNIDTFQTYLAASSSQHLVVDTAKDSSGTLQALSVTIVPASAVSEVAGTVDAAPAPVNGASGGTTTFSIDGLPVSAAVAAIGFPRRATSAAIAAGDGVVAAGTFTGGTLTVGATASGANFVFDSGVPQRNDMPGF